jgi:hypothetical protein
MDDEAMRLFTIIGLADETEVHLPYHQDKVTQHGDYQMLYLQIQDKAQQQEILEIQALGLITQYDGRVIHLPQDPRSVHRLIQELVDRRDHHQDRQEI